MSIDDEGFDGMKAGERVSNMWMDLASKIAAKLPELIYDKEDPALAIKWATCAEACFWKATGEADTHDVKDVLVESPAIRNTERKQDEQGIFSL